MIERCDLSDSCSDQDDHELGRDELVDCGTIVLGDPVFEYIPCFGILVHDIKEISASEVSSRQG